MKKLSFLTLLLLLAGKLSAHGGGNIVHSDIMSTMGPGDKLAVLMVHFGTTHADTRTVTIDALNELARQNFPDTELREAYTSRIVIRRLGEQGMIRHNPSDALKQLQADGFTHILIQPSTVIDGVEMESLHHDAAALSGLFKEIRVGNPLLYTPEDYEAVIDALTAGTDTQTAYVWVGHGTYDSSTAQYTMLDYMLRSKGYRNFFIGTIEGFPAQEDVLAQLADSGFTHVQLVPFMFVAGEHAKNDIAQEWKAAFEEAGYRVSVRMEELGENEAVRRVYLSHLKFLLGHKKIGIMEKKSRYAQGGDRDHHDDH
ncbi:MAG: sirohydrochlorin cobaltochelatase [Rikenellaceae bacterium]|nr:sirohydrochlorin cobaltochelatase [Rikenellaceae bacterium]